VTDSIKQRLESVRQRIRQAEAASGRPDGCVSLLAVSKTQPVEAVIAAHEAGQRAFGENYLQDALEKIKQLAGLGLEWHFIGRIQSNKTRDIAAHFDWVHGLGDAKHARRLADQRPDDLPPLNVCIQINVSGEQSKGGVEPEQAMELIELCRTLPRLSLRGLMTIPAVAADSDGKRGPLHKLRLLRDRLATPELPLDALSMGMSGDLEEAIAEGATIVRIGTAIFGPRNYDRQ